MIPREPSPVKALLRSRRTPEPCPGSRRLPRSVASSVSVMCRRRPPNLASIAQSGSFVFFLFVSALSRLSPVTQSPEIEHVMATPTRDRNSSSRLADPAPIFLSSPDRVQKSVEASIPVVAVSLNYRLSAFGFLWSDAVAAAGGDANVGLRDQRLALRWVQENVAAFGGDPRKVTLFGESAGAIAIGRHLTAYGGRDDGLFRAAILESGGPLERWPYATPDPATYQNELYANLTASTGCDRGNNGSSSTDSLECLRALPFEDLNAALNITDTWIAGTGLGPWVPVVDGDFLREYQSTAIKGGRFVRVPILYGTNTDEGTAIGPSGVSTDEAFRAAVAEGGPDDATVATIEALYPDVPAVGIPAGYALTDAEAAALGTQWKRVAAFFGDAVEHMPRRAAVTAFARVNVTAYSYRFNVRPAGIPLSTGVTHYQEVAWVFNNIEGMGYATNPFNGSLVDRPAYVEVSTLMSRMWVSFANCLDPNAHGLPGYPEWPAYRVDGAGVGGVGSNFVFDANVTSYVERDDWRVPGMAYLYEKAGEQFKF
ncbi:Alpha/Beta hydrolase protein [Xylariomycetidae sp. FL2044]|nr:Alpha/Beta hydrolase protein [Xylariomycetidae sp. FL2044]